MKKHLVISLMSFVSIVAQPGKFRFEDWKKSEIPTTEETIYKYHQTGNSYYVYNENDILVVDTIMPHNYTKLPFNIEYYKNSIYQPKGLVTIQSVDDGYIVGFNQGEFGGKVYWSSKDERSNYEISSDKIKDFIEKDGKLYAIEGLAHLGSSEGNIVELKKENGKWISKKYVTLPSAPSAISVDRKGNFIVVTSKSLLSIDNNRNLNFLIENGIWDVYLYPRSLVVKDDNIFIGMRGGVYQYNLTTKHSDWWTIK